MCKARLDHDTVWTCPSKLDCVLYGHCLQQIRKGYHACAPYPGPANYPVPEVIYEKDTGV